MGDYQKKNHHVQSQELESHFNEVAKKIAGDENHTEVVKSQDKGDSIFINLHYRDRCPTEHLASVGAGTSASGMSGRAGPGTRAGSRARVATAVVTVITFPGTHKKIIIS